MRGIGENLHLNFSVIPFDVTKMCGSIQSSVCTKIVATLHGTELHGTRGDNAFLVFLLQVDTKGWLSLMCVNRDV